MKINLITVCTDNYDTEYARKIITRFKQVSAFDVEAYCITDRPDEVKDFAKVIKTPFLSSGWWNKMFIYSNYMPEGWNLYMDLDIVICKNFDKEIEWAIEQDKDICCVSDAISWLNNRYSSSLVLLRSGSNTHIYDEWLKNKDSLINYRGGDQVWTGRLLEKLGRPATYIDDTFKDLKLNLKFHLGMNVQGGIAFPRQIKESIKMVDCGGRPKPHEISNLSYIKENWHDI